MRILVTGGLGFVGRHVVKAYQDAGHEVVVVDYVSMLPSVRRALGDAYVGADITDPEYNDLDRLFHEWKPEVVNHLAANPSIPVSIQHPEFDADTNVIGTLRLLELSKEYGVKQFIFASSSEVYGPTDNAKSLGVDEGSRLDPQSPYAIGKMAAEFYVRFFTEQAGFVGTIFRYANIYGPGQTPEGGAVIPRFVKALLTGEQVTLNNGGTATRDFVYVGDVARLNRMVVEDPHLTPGRASTYCVGSGKKVSIKRLLELLEQETGKTSKTTQTKRYSDFEAAAVSIEKARRLLGWLPVVPLEIGLQETVQALRELYDRAAV